MTGSLFLKEWKRHLAPFAAGACAAVAWILGAVLLGAGDATEPLGFYAAWCLRPLMVLGSIGAAVLFSGTVRGEWMRGTAEFLLAKPWGRTEVFLGKVLACLSIVLAINAAAYLSGMAALTFFCGADWSVGAFLTLSLHAFLPMPAFGGAGLLSSLIFRRSRRLSGTLGLAVLACFAPDALSWTGGAAAFASIAPLSWANLDAAASGPSLLRIAVPSAIAVASFVGSWAVFRRMDVPEREKR
jgi:ABC-type transport system involved in multi-copper enzyme maturation permease subunit